MRIVVLLGIYLAYAISDSESAYTGLKSKSRSDALAALNVHLPRLSFRKLTGSLRRLFSYNLDDLESATDSMAIRAINQELKEYANNKINGMYYFTPQT